MRFDLGLVLGITFEYILMIYYANTTFYPKDNYLKSSVAAFIGYVLLFAFNTIGYPVISISAFFVINFVIFIIGYNINYKGALFQSTILNVLSIIGEYMMVFMLSINYNILDFTYLSEYQSIILTFISKMIYLVGIVFMKFFIKKNSKKNNDSLIVLILIPSITVICLTLLLYAHIDNNIFVCICVLLLLSNIIVFAVNELVNNKNTELQLLKDEISRNKSELAEYKIISEKYENTRIMQHDFKEQLNTLKALIDSDNLRAKEYMNKIQKVQRELSFAEYSDNKILNILLTKKITECGNRDIDFHINSGYPQLQFISEIDTVAIFSNLINNAMESCMKSAEKNIFLDLSTVNDKFTAVKIENSADAEPKVINGMLRTQKSDSAMHGIGMKSIYNSVKNYGGNVEWSYDGDNKLFRVVVMFNLPKTEKMPTLSG